MAKIEVNNKSGSRIFATVDDEDLEFLSNFTWTLNNGYATTTITIGCYIVSVPMHRMLRRVRVRGGIIDHRNMDKLDNRRGNLRLTDRAGNNANSGPRPSARNFMGLKGVAISGKSFYARITVNNKSMYLGSFKKKEEAAAAYDRAAIKHFGGMARTNFPIESYK
jgi:hypothetical protein